MKSKMVFFVMIVLVSSLGISSVVPYPYFTSSTFLSAKEQQEINDFYENEDRLVDIMPRYEVVNLDWFDSMDTIFKKYVTVRVIDILSGKQYYVQRLGGYNHADVQTIDNENTAIFKSVYGGQWSWTRRPVWVQIGEKFYAGSSNGMPHGFSILDNGEGGHTCIHFLNSKTHGTKRVDPDHQEAIKYAYENRHMIYEYINSKALV